MEISVYKFVKKKKKKQMCCNKILENIFMQIFDNIAFSEMMFVFDGKNIRFFKTNTTR